MAKQWTKAEDEVVKRNYTVHGPHPELWDSRINRSVASIRGRANRLGLKMEEPRKYTKAEWTEHEVNALLRNYPIHGTDMSMWDERINKSYMSVWRRAQYMGLSSRSLLPRLDEKDSKRLSEACGIIAKRFGLTKSELVHELCVMERRGLL